MIARPQLFMKFYPAETETMENTIYNTSRRCPGVFSLAACCCFLLLLFCAEIVLAQTFYIKPSAEIPLRRGQGSDYKILAIVPDGTAVTLLEEADSWARVTTEDGKEGWLLKRYLTEEPPPDQLLAQLRRENNELEEEAATLRAENEELAAVNTALRDTLENNEEQLASTTAEYQKLINDTADVIAIKNSLNQSRETITKLQQELGIIAAENKRLDASRNIKWFLAGGGTFIFGCIIGMISSRSKKRKSSLY